MSEVASSLPTLREFFEQGPLGSRQRVSTESAIGRRGSATLEWPDRVEFHCPKCGLQTFEPISGGHEFLSDDQPLLATVIYACRRCDVEHHFIAVACWYDLSSFTEDWVDVMKFGEVPALGPPLPEELLNLMEKEDRGLMIKGYRCERSSQGLGSLTYYRRVIENLTKRLFSQILRVAETDGSPEATLISLKDALTKTQFTRAVDSAKEAIPPQLYVLGKNPITELHYHASRNIHGMSDEECLAIAHVIREMLSGLAVRIHSVLKDDAVLTEALKALNKARVQ